MPWNLKDVERKTKKATSTKLKRQWLEVANGELAQHGDERRAIMAANGVVSKTVKRKVHKQKGKP